ncbi:hypothetical protein PG996_008794 [Apiospora saccharicola]|uniref:Terpene synthase n=1 Tax=Apiospora saccharicola TaxID=335842 RepID=A0ABR1UZ04_9PEZI
MSSVGTVTAVLQSLSPQSWYSSRQAGHALAADNDMLKLEVNKPEEKTLGERLRPLITSFVEKDLKYEPRPARDNTALWKAADEYAAQTGVVREPGSRSAKIFQTGVMYAAAWADLLRLTYKHWDATPANFIVTASLNFLNSNLLQTGAAFRGIAAAAAANGSNGNSNNSGRSWARYVREKDGGGDAVAYFTFPKSMYPNQEEYLECIPNLARYINLANDVLSFYKEEKAGEDDNFISQMAMYENKDKIAIVEDLIADVAQAVERIRATIQGKEPYASAVEDHILGYVAFHKLSPRYRLSEVGLGEETFQVAAP